MWQNIEMSTYCSTQTFYTTTNSYFFINVQFCLEVRTIFFTVGQNHEDAYATCAKFARPRKKARNIEYKCLNQFVTDASESRISSWHLI